MQSSLCTTCQKPKAPFICGICQSAICKKCAQFLPKDSFSFFKNTPKDLHHEVYCISCFDEKVSPELQSYEQAMARARDIFVFNKKQSKETRAIRRKQEPIRVTDCTDKDEALLRLAFFAAEANFNALIDVELSPKTIKVNGYQTTKWDGVGIPVNINLQSRLLR